MILFLFPGATDEGNGAEVAAVKESGGHWTSSLEAVADSTAGVEDASGTFPCSLSWSVRGGSFCCCSCSSSTGLSVSSLSLHLLPSSTVFCMRLS